MKVYITKYALTKGIQEREVNAQVSISNPKALQIKNGFGLWFNSYYKPHWHLTRAEAQAQAEKMRLAKIKSLEKQLDKLRRLSFKEADLKVEK